MGNTVKTLRLGLVGKDVSKSLSEEIHTFILGRLGVQCEYERISVSKADFDGAMVRLLGDFDGFNVTIPYKKEVFEYLYEIDNDASACSSVNTVLCDSKKGYNTDGVGFLLMLYSAGVEVKGKKVLVLGVGGSGSSSALALKNAGADVYAYRRNKAELLEICQRLGVTPVDDAETGGYDMLVNCTGVGMHDTEGKSPVEQRAFVGAKWAVDLIYAPEKSKFLELGESMGAKILNGKSMLFYQAYFADCLYLGKQSSRDEAKRLYEEYLQNKSLS